MATVRNADTLRVLVVDDNRDAAEMLAKLLAEVGLHAQSAYDGRTAILLASQFKPQVVLLDIMMPKMDGFEARAVLGEIHGLESARFIAVTASNDPAVWNQLEDAGFDSALVKPVSLDALIKVFINVGLDISFDSAVGAKT